jgi:hypothetical protein
MICGGDGSTCKDCEGTLNGDAVLDNCGDCVGGDTGETACVQYCNDDGCAQINGSGDITYTGSPAKVDTQVNGSGDITKR